MFYLRLQAQTPRSQNLRRSVAVCPRFKARLGHIRLRHADPHILYASPSLCVMAGKRGYVERAGRNEKRAILYRATTKAAASPETPYPPIRESDPFQKERTAAATITRLMLCADPTPPKRRGA